MCVVHYIDVLPKIKNSWVDACDMLFIEFRPNGEWVDVSLPIVATFTNIN